MTLYGSQSPRVFTPPAAPLEPRTPETESRTLGYSVIDFADEFLEVELYPWQRWLLIHMLELKPGTKRFRFRNVVVLVARQNGKSTLSQVLALWAMYVLGVDLVLGTAQDLDTSEEIWEGAVSLVTETDPDTDQPIRPELFELAHVDRGNGKKSLNVLTSRYKVKAANRRAGRGLSGDLIFLDELREHQSFAAWGAITKTTMARPNALIVCLSNAGDVTSVVLSHLRRLGHRQVGDPDGICAAYANIGGIMPPDSTEPDLGLFEWSAAPGCDIYDPDGHAAANPSVGYGLVEESTILSAASTDPEPIFRTEVLCQWADGLLSRPFPPGKWEIAAVPHGPNNSLPQRERIVADHRVCAGVTISADRSRAYVAVAGYRRDDTPQVEIAVHNPGDAWLTEWFTSPAAPWRRSWQIAVEARSTAAVALAAANLQVTEWPQVEHRLGWSLFYDAVRDGRIRHTGQPVLSDAAASAQVKDGQIARARLQNGGDPAALAAATAAVWLLLRPRKITSSSASPPRKAERPTRAHELQTVGF